MPNTVSKYYPENPRSRLILKTRVFAFNIYFSLKVVIQELRNVFGFDK